MVFDLWLYYLHLQLPESSGTLWFLGRQFKARETELDGCCEDDTSVRQSLNNRGRYLV